MSEQRRRRGVPGPAWAWALASALVVLLLGVAWAWPAYFGDPRPFVAATPAPTPSSPTLFAPVEIPAGSQLCMDPVTLPPDGRIAQFRTMAPMRSAPALSLRVSGPGGYRATASEPSDATGDVLSFTLQPPPRALADGRVCLRNDGERRIVLAGSNEVFTASARPVSTLDGNPVVPKVALSFFTGERGGIGDHLGDVLRHAAAFKPFGAVLLGLVALLLLIGLPLATIGGLVWTLRREEREGEPS